MTVYKYYNFEDKYCLSNLKNCVVYFALANEWKQNNEIEFTYKNNSKKELYDFYLNEASVLNKKEFLYKYHVNNLKSILYLPYKKCSIEELMNFSAESFLQNKEQNEARYRDKLLNAVRIFSTCKTNNNVNNWNQFASNSSGFCIGYKRDSIVARNCIITYEDKIPEIDLKIKRNNYYPFFRLPEIYENENEIRFLKVIDGSFRKHENECIMKLNPTDIVSITAGLNIEPNNLEKLNVIAKNHYLHIQVTVGLD